MKNNIKQVASSTPSVKRYIGLSLSFCIKDILEGRMSIDEISAIVTSTAFDSIEHCMEYYYEHSYWGEYNKDYVLSTLKRMWPLIFQPRINVDKFEHRGHVISKGWWVDTHTGLIIRDKNSIQALKFLEC